MTATLLFVQERLWKDGKGLESGEGDSNAVNT